MKAKKYILHSFSPSCILRTEDKAPVPKQRYFQEPLFRELKKDYCYVCYGRIKKDEGIYIGHDLWRHKKCKPGSNNWLKSRVGKENPLPCLHGSPEDI